MTTKLPGAGFNPDDMPDSPTLPDGWYLWDIVDAEFCEGSKEGSTYIKLTFDGVKGTPSESERIWQNYTWENQNPTAVRMGRKAFAKVCKACGVGGIVSDLVVLRGRRVLGDTYTEKGTGGYEDKNQLRDYNSPTAASAGGAPPVPAAQPQPPQAPQYAPPAPPQYAPPAPAPAPQWAGQPPAAPPQQQYQQPPAEQYQQPQQTQPPQAPPNYGTPPAPGQPPAMPGQPAPWHGQNQG